VVYAAENISDDAQAGQRLLDEGFDVRNVAITAEPTDLPSAPPRPATRAEIQVYEEMRLVIHARTAQAGLLVLGDYFYPGWAVSVDGQRATARRVNLFWRGVDLSAGDHTVVFQFEPMSLKIGLGLSGTAIIGLGALVLADVFGLLPAQKSRAKVAPLSD
jgi:hypothetical protein